MKTKLIVFGLLFVAVCSASLSYSGVPQMINYQGKLTTPQGALMDTTIQMVYTIYDAATDGGVLWTETQPSVVVEKGIFSVLLGSVNPIPDSVFPGDVRYLGVKVGEDDEMSPRKAIVSVAYSYKSEFADTAAYAQVAVSDGDWTPDTSGINIYRLTGNVGIGTPMPGSKLELNGDGTLQFAINNTSGRNWVMRSDNAGKFSLWDWSAANDACIVTSSGAPDAFTFEFKGDVGIGTPSPGSKLEIKGDGALQFAINNTSGRNWAMRSDDTGKFSLWDWSGANDAYVVTSSGAPDAFTFEFKGDVGIGTPSPAQKLHVAGNAQVDDTLFASNVSSNSPLSLQTAGTTRMYIDDASGNVGIGTSAPAAKLQVESSNVYSGYFTSDSLDSSTHVLHSEFTGTGAYDAKAVYGKSTPSDGFGYGGYFEGGHAGVHGEVVGSGDKSYYGVSGYASGDASKARKIGVYGEANGFGINWGVYGRATAGRPTDVGVLGISDGTGVQGNGQTGVRGNGQAYDFYAAGPGTNYGPFTGAHEVKFSQGFPGIVKPGMIVSATGESQIRKTDQGEISFSSTLPTVQLSDTPDDSKVLGVLISELPLDEDHWYINEAEPGDRFGAVNALGEGRVWVTNINEEIKAGDYITTSSIAGYGQKQNDDLIHSYTLGKAIEDVDWDNVTETVEFNGKTYKAYPVAVVYTSG